MRKQIKLFILIIVLISIFYVPISYAIEANFELNIKNDLNINNQEQNKLDFFTVDSKEKEIGSTLNMYINLSQINYDISKFTLTSPDLVDNISTEVIENSDGIEIKKEDNEFSLIINKNELNIEQIILTYTISNNFKVGDKFTLIGKISEYKEEILEDNLQENIENDVEENGEEKTEINMENDIKEVQIEITIIEKKENEKEVENLNEQNKTEGFNQVQNSMQTNVKYNTVNFNNTETVVYKGSQNNYLETLSVEDYVLNTEFSKENTTYFLTVSNDITSVKITTTKEVSSSTVCIYGNDDLKVGTNKVLISVTAENGDVRNYRIFVNREE